MKRFFRWSLWLAGLIILPAVSAAVIPDRYIVELASPPVAVRAGAHGRRPNEALIVRHRRDVRVEQERVRQALEREGAQVVDSVDTVANALMVRMPASEAARLATVPGVKRVHPVRTFRLLLDRAVVVNKVVDAWNQIGLDRAGLGMKIGMIDSGIDNTHPGFQDSSLPIPAGFPKVNQDSEKTFTNSKVIVARSYASLFIKTDPDTSARDHKGHGTATAMAAAGELAAGPRATIRGVAPKAYLGNYKIFGSPGVNDEASESAILKAINDAVADGMDVINLSFGFPVADNLADDPEVSAIEHATAMGVIVVASAGNAGPDLRTIGPPAIAPSAISVGASANDRAFGGSATVGGTRYFAIPGSGPAPAQALTAPIKDVAATGNDGRACSSMPAGSLQGDIALILRGPCFFSDKIANAQAAGAVGVLVYTDQARPDPITMSVGGATLPAVMVAYEDGIKIKAAAASNSSLKATLNFTIQPSFVDSDKLADFTSKGPNVDNSIKPDLVAVGSNVYTAAETSDSKGDIYDPSGFLTVDGTSFSSPIVAGAAALLKAAHPGLTVDEYRSLLINTAAPISLSFGTPSRIQQSGAGLLDMNAAVHATSAETPTSLSFAIGAANIQQSRTVKVFNVGSAAETFNIFAAGRDAPSGPVPPGSRTAAALEALGKRPTITVSTNSLTLQPGASANVTVTITGFGLMPGAYEGFVHVVGATSGIDERIPYWYGVPSGIPVNLTILNTVTDAKAGALSQNAVYFRVTDASGITVPGVKPAATVVSGGGAVIGVNNEDAFYPGVFGLDVRLGAVVGSNVFHIAVGSLSQDVTITSQ